jgi:murein DD-endopeptidase MepM/ murein hydrolase activator NlpD
MRDEGELYVTAEPARRASRRALTADVEPDERRGWLYYGLASLGISALGLAAAGSLALTTSAQTTGDGRPVSAPAVAAPAIGAGAGTAPAVTKPQAAAVTTFARRPNLTDSDDNRSAALRIAIVKEEAAQRAEELAKEADDLTRAAQIASSDARQSKLTAADRASGLAAARAADEKLRRAVAARVAAAVEREAHEVRERADVTSTRRSSPERSSIPTGGDNDGAGSDSGGGGVSPVPGAVIGASFGQTGIWSRYHTGIDFRAAYGTPIRAVKSGVVLFAGNKGDWAGNHVAVRHGDGRTTMSSHMSSMAVGSGQTVQAGQVIGYVGQTGRAFGAHLHFELYPVGVRYGDVYRAINPQPWLAANGVQTR